MEALRRMQWRGPDIAIVLYAYIVFAFVSHDNDYSDILMLVDRAKKAEEVREKMIRAAKGEPPSQALENGTYVHGKVFEFASLGFFKFAATSKDNCVAWHNYAACRFLIYNDFMTSFDSFLGAFRKDPKNKKLKANFDVMMNHFHGNNGEDMAAIIRDRMQIQARQDDELAEERRIRTLHAKERADAATKIKKWFKFRMANYKFKLMMKKFVDKQNSKLYK